MISWLFIIILSYFFFSIASLGDKIVLDGPSKPITFTFYVAFSSILTIVIIPFIPFVLPSPYLLLWIIADAIVFILAIYTMYVAIAKFDVTRVVTTIGAIQPLFVFLLTYLAWGTLITNKNIFAFVLLLIGSICISLEKNKQRGLSYLKLTLLSSFLASLDYVFSKVIFLSEPFLSGFIQTRIAIFILSLLFLLSQKNRREIFSKKNVKNGKADLAFLGGQLSGGLATFLQYLAISLTPVALLPILNSLRGVQYVFIFLLTLFLSIVFPKILKEKISKGIIIQKIVSIIFIVAGLALLVL